MQNSKIEWTGRTWNPLTGCDKISAGCKHCYAETLAKSLQAKGYPKYRNGFKLTLHDYHLKSPYKWENPEVVFVNSMSDMFHKDVPVDFVQKVFRTMNETQRHTYQILTKRADRLLQLNKELNWTDNIWMGVSVEDEQVKDRIDMLRMTDAKVKFLSIEPLIAPLPNLNLENIDWVIVGGESGWGARPMKEEWVIDIKDQCLAAGVPFFFKQWGGVNKKNTGRLLEGRTYDEMPK